MVTGLEILQAIRRGDSFDEWPSESVARIGPLSGRGFFGSLGLRNWSKSITTADGRDLQVQGSMFGVPAFVNDLEVRFMAAHDADQHVCLVLFPEVSTETALSILNCFHILASPV